MYNGESNEMYYLLWKLNHGCNFIMIKVLDQFLLSKVSIFIQLGCSVISLLRETHNLVSIDISYYGADYKMKSKHGQPHM